MVKALLDGRKRETRRPLKVQTYTRIDRRRDGWVDIFKSNELITCPYGVEGDILWVREGFGLGEDGKVIYRANSEGILECDWRSPLFMRREWSRLNLLITEILVERLQDINLVNMWAEGLRRFVYKKTNAPTNDPRWRFIELWDEIYKEKGFGWETNPWVWVICFEVEVNYG